MQKHEKVMCWELNFEGILTSSDVTFLSRARPKHVGAGYMRLSISSLVEPVEFPSRGSLFS